MSPSKPVEDEDLDDLDDVLEQFTHQPTPQKSSLPQSSSATASKSKSPAPPEEEEEEEALSEDFAKHLAEEMETMMRQLSGTGGAASSGSASTLDAQAQAQQEAAFKDAWAKMTTQDLESAANGNGLNTFLGLGDDPYEGSSAKENGESTAVEKGKDTTADSEEEDPFQKAIRQAMEKLQDSDDNLKADSRSGADSLEGLLASLGDLKLGEDGAEGEGAGAEGLESMLETMMSQLMSKEILYDPLKELDTKYPEYLSQHSSTLSAEDLSRYKDQKDRVSQIVTLFENPAYSDDNPEQSAEVLRLMNEMQSYGSPPSEIMGPMPPGFDLGTDGLPKIPDGCVVC